MTTKKAKSNKKPAAKALKATKIKKANVALSRINVSIAKSLHNQLKRCALKNKITLQAIISSAIKEYLNKANSN